jgi:hypothetical protein
MPRPISPMEMIPTVMARMVAGVYGGRYGKFESGSTGEIGCLCKGKDLAERASCLLRLILASSMSIFPSASSL